MSLLSKANTQQEIYELFLALELTTKLIFWFPVNILTYLRSYKQYVMLY